MDRRTFLQTVIATALAGPAAASLKTKGDARPFSAEWLVGEAERLSKADHKPMPLIPEAWRTLTYDEYRHIWFDPRNGLWTDKTDGHFAVDFFHPGLYFPRAVEIAVVEGGMAQPLAFDLSLFDKTDQWPEPPIDDTLGYSGFRLRGEIETAGVLSEFTVFQGASYFRAIGSGQNYGLSARGLAIATGEPEGEEFPDFTHFWIETPGAGDEGVVVHALLDSPSVAGAYRFHVSPGLPTVMDVEATLFPRAPLRFAGIAPLTSMFLFDETNRARFDDFRSAVHDSGGLLIHNGAGELLWRPLANPTRLQISSFLDTDPRGFGLMQRERAEEDFADLEARYEARPSLWITPGDSWGDGSVTLVEIPSDKEIYDNIVAFWRPRTPLEPGRAHRFTYRMQWGEEPQRPADVARVLNTRIGKGYDKDLPGQIVTVDFDDHPGFGDGTGVSWMIRATNGRVSEGILQRNPGTGGWRLSFNFDPAEAQLAEIRAQLTAGGAPLSEVWLYRWTA